MTTPFHAKYWSHSLLLARPQNGVEALSRSIGNARVDLNPHQLDAALFALRSPYSRGVLLADEVGLGKTIEAALILAQKWAVKIWLSVTFELSDPVAGRKCDFFEQRV